MVRQINQSCARRVERLTEADRHQCRSQECGFPIRSVVRITDHYMVVDTSSSRDEDKIIIIFICLQKRIPAFVVLLLTVRYSLAPLYTHGLLSSERPTSNFQAKTSCARLINDNNHVVVHQHATCRLITSASSIILACSCPAPFLLHLRTRNIWQSAPSYTRTAYETPRLKGLDHGCHDLFQETIKHRTIHPSASRWSQPCSGILHTIIACAGCYTALNLYIFGSIISLFKAPGIARVGRIDIASHQ